MLLFNGFIRLIQFRHLFKPTPASSYSRKRLPTLLLPHLAQLVKHHLLDARVNQDLDGFRYFRVQGRTRALRELGRC